MASLSLASHFSSSPATALASSSYCSPHYSASHQFSHVTTAFVCSSKYLPITQPSRPIFVQKCSSKEPPLLIHELGAFDRLLLTLFRDKMVQEVGWDSKKEGYDGLIEVSRHLMAKYKTSPHIEEATVSRVTQATCQWLMGPCRVNHVELSDGSLLASGVLVERCKYLEESKCASICVHTCKLPTQSFIKSEMGVPLAMEPNFEDFSCQFKFGVEAPPPHMDEALRPKCLDVCPSAAARIRTQMIGSSEQCPEVSLRF
ncbi:hypothetical protein O6H91_04G047500 [Diphasiastrum complanatum]|uniref:Uncharacterized protein n=1 Tax=Diphasiastrum complanatum TaxID=34168 RepID=A0ACC2DWE3_DIPCM|nr:hypothetical protein O6H91_04G047500 [Diphasiastrum complanatum]